MLEEKIEVLFNTIKDRQKQWCKYRDLFGEDYFLTKEIFNSLYGLEEAFQILSGRSYTSVVIERLHNAINAVSART